MKSYEQMQDDLSENARYELKSGLAQCTESEQHRFKQMYADGDLEPSIDEVVDGMAEDKLDWAMQQVQRTLEKKSTT